MRKTLKKTQRN